MKMMTKRAFSGLMVLAVVAVGTLKVSAAAPPSEDKLIADLASPKEGTVTDALAKIEKEYPKTTKALPAMKKLLTDPRKKVMVKAARVLGAINADVSEEDVKNIAVLLKSPDKNDIIDGLKSLRGLKAQSTVPQIVPLLQNANPNVKRDACRTLAVLGDKSVVPSIEPLLKDPDAAVETDAANAINILKLK